MLMELIAAKLKAETQTNLYRTSGDARTMHALACEAIAQACAHEPFGFDRVGFLRACGLDDATIEAI